MSLYVIECAGLLKVGYSENPERRTANLFQSGSRYSAPRAAYEARGTQRLLLVIDRATKSDVRAAHLALDDYAIGCEWFLNESPVRDFLVDFQPGTMPAPLVRAAGPAWESTPPRERGGGNADLAMSVLAKRRRAAA